MTCEGTPNESESSLWSRWILWSIIFRRWRRELSCCFRDEFFSPSESLERRRPMSLVTTSLNKEKVCKKKFVSKIGLLLWTIKKYNRKIENRCEKHKRSSLALILVKCLYFLKYETNIKTENHFLLVIKMNKLRRFETENLR